MELGADGKKAVCPYCGRELLIKHRDTAKEAYDRQLARERASAAVKEEQAQKGRRRVAKVYLGIAAFFAVCVLIAIFIPGTGFHEMVFPETVDFYENVEVTFSGDSGSGKAHVTNKNSGELRDVRVTATPAENLVNGDTVTIKAEKRTGYRYQPSEMTVEVTGLTEWVLETGMLPDEALAKIHANTERLIRKEWDAVVDTGTALSYEIEPYRLYLFVEKDPDYYDRNYLYDSYKVTTTRSDGAEVISYEACRYANLKLQTSGDLTAEYGTLQGFNFGYMSGFSYATSFSGWLDADEMEADLRQVRESCDLVP